MESKRVDIFGSFLTGAPSTPESGLTPPVAVPRAATPVPATPSAEAVAAQIEAELLSLFAKAPGPLSVKALVEGTSGSATQVLKTLAEMETVGILQRVEADDSTAYRLTKIGDELSR
jgi:predicted transcriptional regulator